MFYTTNSGMAAIEMVRDYGKGSGYSVLDATILIAAKNGIELSSLIKKTRPYRDWQGKNTYADPIKVISRVNKLILDRELATEIRKVE